MKSHLRRARRWIAEQLPPIVLILALAALVFFGIRVIQIERRAAHEDTIRATQVNSDYEACVRSIPALRRFKRFVRGVQRLHDTLYENALALHKATPPETEAYAAQVGNLARLKAAVDDVSGTGLTDFRVPTKSQCAAARDARLRGEPVGQVGVGKRKT